MTTKTLFIDFFSVDVMANAVNLKIESHVVLVNNKIGQQLLQIEGLERNKPGTGPNIKYNYYKYSLQNMNSSPGVVLMRPSDHQTQGLSGRPSPQASKPAVRLDGLLIK